MTNVAQRAQPTFNDRLPLQGRHGLTPSRKMDGRDGQITKPRARREWCPGAKVNGVATLFGHCWGSQRSLFLCPAELCAGHHCAPVRGRLLPAIPGFRPRRTSRRTWEKARVRALIQVAPPAQSSPQKAGSSPQLLAPFTARDGYPIGSRLQHLGMVWSPKPLGPQNYRAPSDRNSPERELRYISLGRPHAPTPWLRADTDPHASYPCGRGGLLKSAGSMQGTRLPVKKEGVPFDQTQTRTSLLSTKNKINLEDVCDPIFELVTPTLCLSVTPMTLCPHLTSGQVQNKTAAPCNLTVNYDESRVMSMRCYPQCGLGPDTPEGDSSCLVSCCTQYEFLLRAREVNHLRLVGLLIVCAAPFSEVVPFCEELTGVYPSLVSSRPSAVLRTIRDILLRRADPPRTTDGKGKIPARRANRLCATELKKEVPVRRLGPLCTTESPVEAFIVRSNPLCMTELTRKIPVKIRRFNPSCTAGLKGVVPIRRVTQSCAAGAAGSKGMVPTRRVNRSGTTKWEGECEESTLIGLPSRTKSQCPERDAVRRIGMPLDASEMGARRGRTGCAEMEIFPSPQGSWARHDLCNWNCVANFIPLRHDCRDLNLVIAVAVEQSNRVSSLSYNPTHLFSLHPDLTVTDLLWWKGKTLLCRFKSGGETQKRVPRTPQGSDHPPVSPWAIVTTTLRPEFPVLSTSLLPAPDITATTPASSARDDMGLRTTSASSSWG